MDNEESKKVKEVVNKEEYNAKQREWYKWRKRAKKVGVSPLKSRRPTPAQRKECVAVLGCNVMGSDFTEATSVISELYPNIQIYVI